MLTLPWRRGPEWAAEGEVLVSVTTFQMSRFRDLPGAYLAGLRLRRSWPGFSGAVALKLWARPFGRRSGAISVWRGEADLRRFVSSREHVAIVRDYRGRGAVSSQQWPAARFAAREVERRARRDLVRAS